MQRTKGATFEREVCDVLSSWFHVPVKRHIGQSRDGGNDITFTPLVIECKRRKEFKTLEGYLDQARAAIPKQSDNRAVVPTVVLRSDGGKRLVLLELDAFLTLSHETLAKYHGVAALI